LRWVEDGLNRLTGVMLKRISVTAEKAPLSEIQIKISDFWYS